MEYTGPGFILEYHQKRTWFIFYHASSIIDKGCLVPFQIPNPSFRFLQQLADGCQVPLCFSASLAASVTWNQTVSYGICTEMMSLPSLAYEVSIIILKLRLFFERLTGSPTWDQRSFRETTRAYPSKLSPGSPPWPVIQEQKKKKKSSYCLNHCARSMC